MRRQARTCRALVLPLALALAACAPSATSHADKPTTGALLDARRSAGIPDCPAGAEHPKVPDGLPDVALECLGGTSFVSLPSLAGQPTLIVAWAPWCDPCRTEAPLLARTLPAYDGRLQVLLVDVADPQPEHGLDFARDAGLTHWPMVVDPNWAMHTGLGTQHVLPVSYIVGSDGRVVQRKVGGWKSEDEIHSALSENLGVEPA